jgi:hypothetical protein
MKAACGTVCAAAAFPRAASGGVISMAPAKEKKRRETSWASQLVDET